MARFSSSKASYLSRYKRTSIGNSKRSNPRSKNRKLTQKPYRGQGRP